MKKRVVITGVGAISPLGLNTKETWEGIKNGKSGISEITLFDISQFPTRFAGEIKNFNPEDFIDKKEAKKMDRFIQFAVATGVMAVKDSGIKIDESNGNKIGVIIGAGMGGLSTLERFHTVLMNEGPRRVSPFFIPMLIPNLASGQLAIFVGARGPNTCITTACAAGAHSIGEAFRLIQRGDAVAMISGGSEASVTPLALAGFCNMKALSSRNDEPQKASRPFDKERDGFVMAEGAGIVILEELEFAIKRNARIYAEIVGYGLSGDAYHITSPDPDGSGAYRCMEMAVNDAGIGRDEINYINAHGTSTYYNDMLETKAIKNLFGEHSKKLAISSTKSMTGHLLGAAGGIEAVFSALSLYEQILPPTINYENPDPDCDLDYVPNTARKADIMYTLSNSFGFGGTNASLVFKRYTGK